MILSDKYRLGFLHNPKVGGTSVRGAIEHLHDVEPVFWGTDPDAAGPPLDRAHLGLDEIAEHYPAVWARMRGYDLFCLYRDPWGRFFSSLAEHSKLHGETDTRFATAPARKAALMDMVARLDNLGNAEATVDHYDLRHFRPQWIYWTAQSAPDVEVTALPMQQIDTLFATIGTRTGTQLQSETRNRGDQLDLPGPLAQLAGRKNLKALLRHLPGATAVKSAMRARFTVPSTPKDRFALSPQETQDVQAFIKRFYARDLALWPDKAGPS